MGRHVDIGELIVEVMGWHPRMVAAFTSVTGGQSGWPTSWW